MTVTAVFDVGKTNLKLTAAASDGRRLETLTAVNPSRPGPPYRHHDLDHVEAWLLDGLRDLASRHAITAIVVSAHGSGGVLVDDHGPAMPMIDYEQSPPPEVDALYREIAGSFRERGSGILLGAAHLARQMLWLDMGWPDAVRRARAFLATPQYWAWRLSGVMAGEVTSLAAQSHLWATLDGQPARLVEERGWGRLMPQLRRAWDALGPLRPDWAARTGLPRDVRVLCGIHDSSANVYSYQAAGLSDLTVVSTGTWIAGISDRLGSALDAERPGLCSNADVHGRPMPGILCMGGREFSAVAGPEPKGLADPDRLARVIDSGTFALPSFGSDDGLFPGTARAGTILGPLADDPGLRMTLAVLYAALLTDRCLASLPGSPTIVLDGSFVRDPLYGAIVAALNPCAEVLVNPDQYGLATGAALLASHTTRTRPAQLAIDRPPPLALPDLFAYRADWLTRTQPRRT